jgi:hypothetical protein
MIPHAKSNVVSMSGGVGETQAYTFQANAHMAMILSDKLYSNKPEAIIREYIVGNAMDAMIEAGRGHIPVDVHLPTSIEPWLSVEDTGVGLDHEEVTGIFTSYGASTKRDSNLVAGTMGLGSKAWAAYTDQATLTATKGGVRRVYSLFKDSTGMPSITTMGDPVYDNSLPNGVKIHIGVLPGDMDAFTESAENLFRRCDPRPNILGKSIDIKDYETVLEGTDWVLRKEESSRNSYHSYSQRKRNNEPCAIQGNIAYRISYEEMKTHISNEDTLHFMLELPLDITFEMGELEVAASREELSYNKQTIDAIIKKFTQVHKEVVVDVIPELFDGCANMWEATCKLAELRESIDNNSYNKMIQSMATFDGYQIEKAIDVHMMRKNPKHTPNINSYADTYQPPFVDKYKDVTCYVVSQDRLSLKTFSLGNLSTNQFSLFGGKKYLVLWDDESLPKQPSRLKNYMVDKYGEAQRTSRYYNHSNKNYPENVIIIRGATRAEMNLIADDMGGHEWYEFNKLIPEAPKVVRGTGGTKVRSNTRPMLVKFTGNEKKQYLGEREALRGQWVDFQMDTSVITSGYYVNLKAWEVQTCDGINRGWHNIYALVGYASNIGLIDRTTDIYGVPGNVSNPFKNEKGWVELSEAILTKTVAWFNDPTNCVALKVNEALAEAADRYSNESTMYRIIDLLTSLNKYGTLLNSSVAKEVYTYITSYNLDPTVIKSYQSIQDQLVRNDNIYDLLTTQETEKKTVAAKLSKLEEKFTKKYPLLTQLSEYKLADMDKINPVCDYIKLKESN